jgi:hypothetical protein
MSTKTIQNNSFTLSTLKITKKIIFPDGSVQTTAYTGDNILNTSTYTITQFIDGGIICSLSNPLTLINTYGTNTGSFYFQQNNLNINSIDVLFNVNYTGDVSLNIYDVNNTAPSYTTNNTIYIINNNNKTLYYGNIQFYTSGLLTLLFDNIVIVAGTSYTISLSTFSYM